MVEPKFERLADFSVERLVLGRYSTDADVTAQLIDVGEGTHESDYAETSFPTACDFAPLLRPHMNGLSLPELQVRCERAREGDYFAIFRRRSLSA